MSIPAWPDLPPVLQQHLAETAHDDEYDDADPDDRDGAAPPRPWDLCALSGDLRTAVWTWLDEVAAWINTTYGTHHQVIPGCWPDHPAIAHDLAGLAFTRLDTYAASTAAYVGRWHNDLEDFHRRLTTTLGPDAPCTRGHHEQQPARYAVEQANRAMTNRR
jgi:hypothetical protein